MDISLGLPSVSVPVLSTTSAVKRLAVCSASPLRTRTPCSAALLELPEVYVCRSDIVSLYLCLCNCTHQQAAHVHA